MQNITDEVIKKAKQNALPRHLHATDLVFDHDKELMTVKLRNGNVLAFSLDEFPSLKNANPKQRENWNFTGGGRGVHWKEIDEDLTVRGFIRSFIARQRNFIQKNEALVS